jgi:hypothetical protein
VIEFYRRLKKAGIKRGDRKIYWVGYEQNDLPCREYYLTSKAANDRATMLAKQRGENNG